MIKKEPSLCSLLTLATGAAPLPLQNNYAAAVCIFHVSVNPHFPSLATANYFPIRGTTRPALFIEPFPILFGTETTEYC